MVITQRRLQKRIERNKLTNHDPTNTKIGQNVEFLIRILYDPNPYQIFGKNQK